MVFMCMKADFGRIMQWADQSKSMDVLVHATDFTDLSQAVDIGADGVGCMCTEFLFRIDLERLDLFRSFLYARTKEETDTYKSLM